MIGFFISRILEINQLILQNMKESALGKESLDTPNEAAIQCRISQKFSCGS